MRRPLFGVSFWSTAALALAVRCAVVEHSLAPFVMLAAMLLLHWLLWRKLPAWFERRRRDRAQLGLDFGPV